MAARGMGRRPQDGGDGGGIAEEADHIGLAQAVGLHGDVEQLVAFGDRDRREVLAVVGFAEQGHQAEAVAAGEVADCHFVGDGDHRGGDALVFGAVGDEAGGG